MTMNYTHFQKKYSDFLVQMFVFQKSGTYGLRWNWPESTTQVDNNLWY